MAETLLQFQTAVVGPDGVAYRARACGSPMAGGTWQGWIEFVPVNPHEAAPVRSPRETTQPNRADTAYWASGLTPIYLEGALRRALAPAAVAVPPAAERPVFDGPAPHLPAESTAAGMSVMDPFSVYQKGEPLLRRQLAALSAWHLINIVVEYELSVEERHSLERLPPAALIDVIVHGVKAEVERTPVRRT